MNADLKKYGSGLSGSQEDALEQLEFFWKLKRNNIEDVAGISTRPLPLLIGPSGCGKTHLVRAFASNSNREIPLFSINVNNFIVRGAAKAEPTLYSLRTFIRENPFGIICLEEVDKLNKNIATETAWTADVQCEIFTLLDRDERLISMEWSREILERFQNYMLIGVGAFHELTSARWKTRSCGFGMAQNTDANPVDEVKKQSGIADELLYRFNERIIFIEPPTREEFARRIRDIRAELELPPLSEEELSAVAADAVESNLHFRFLESYVGDAIKESDILKKVELSDDVFDSYFSNPPLPSQPEPVSSEKIAKDSERFKMSIEYFARVCGELEAEALWLEASLSSDSKPKLDLLRGIPWKTRDPRLNTDLAGQLRIFQDMATVWPIECCPTDIRRACEWSLFDDGKAFFDALHKHLRAHPEIGKRLHRAAMKACVAFQKTNVMYNHLMAYWPSNKKS